MKVFFLFEQNISPVNSVLGHSSVPFSGALADLPVGFPYRFNSSLLLFFFLNLRHFKVISVILCVIPEIEAMRPGLEDTLIITGLYVKLQNQHR